MFHPASYFQEKKSDIPFMSNHVKWCKGVLTDDGNELKCCGAMKIEFKYENGLSIRKKIKSFPRDSVAYGNWK